MAQLKEQIAKISMKKDSLDVFYENELTSKEMVGLNEIVLVFKLLRGCHYNLWRALIMKKVAHQLKSAHSLSSI